MGYRLRDLGCTRTCRGSGGVGMVGLGMFFSFLPPLRKNTHPCSGLNVRYRRLSSPCTRFTWPSECIVV